MTVGQKKKKKNNEAGVRGWELISTQEGRRSTWWVFNFTPASRHCGIHSKVSPSFRVGAISRKATRLKKKEKSLILCVCLDSDMTSHGWKLQSNPFLHFMDGWMVPFTQKSDVEQKSEKRWRKITKSILIQGKKTRWQNDRSSLLLQLRYHQRHKMVQCRSIFFFAAAFHAIYTK